MRAIDTNVIVRFLTADDPVQAEAARKIIAAGDIFIGITVLLETEWVLRAAYRLRADEIANALHGLAGLPGITVEEPDTVATALAWSGQGMDFADALHLARSADCSTFVTFDRKLAKRASDVSPLPVVVP